MACEICGSDTCIAPYHSDEEQRNFYEIANRIKGSAKAHITSKIDRLKGHYHGDNYYVKLDDVLNIIDDYD